VFSGRTAAYLHGAPELADVRGLSVEVTVPAGVRFGPVQGLRVRRADLPGSDIAEVGGWRCTTGLRTALDIARWEPLPEAVAGLDLLLARRVVEEAALRDAAGARNGRGSRQARRAVDLADARAESQPESKLRVTLTLAASRPCHSTWSEAPAASSSHASTSRTRTSAWRSSTTGPGTPRTDSSCATAAG